MWNKKITDLHLLLSMTIRRRSDHFSNNIAELNAFKSSMSSIFKMTDMREVKYFLGVNIIRNRAARLLYLHQRHYVKSVLRNCNMDKSNPRSTPMQKSCCNKVNPVIDYLASSDVKSEGSEHGVPLDIHYSTIVGQIMYLMLATRPDFAFPIIHLSQFTSNPAPEHWKAIRHLLRYLRGASQWCLLEKHQ